MTPEELRTKLKNLANDMKPAIMDGMEKAAMNVESRAKSNCQPGETPYYRAPKITGTLQRSITSDVKDEGNTIKGIVGTNIQYAPAVHDGDSRMPPRPFILDAIVQEEDKTAEFLSAAVEDAAKKHVS